MVFTLTLIHGDAMVKLLHTVPTADGRSWYPPAAKAACCVAANAVAYLNERAFLSVGAINVLKGISMHTLLLRRTLG